MAELTSNIGNVTNRIGVQDPGPAAPSFIETLAGVAGNAMDFMDVRRSAQARREAEAAQSAADAARDEIAQAHIDDMSAQFLETSSSPADGVPDDVVAETQRLVAQQRGVNQGRVNPTRAATNLEATVIRLRNEHPEMAAEILTYMRQEGLDSRLFREQRLEEEAAEARRAARQQQENDFRQLAVTTIPPDQLAPTWEGQVQQGQLLAVKQNELETVRAAAAEARAQEDQDAERAQRARATRNQAAFGNARTSLQINVGKAITGLQADIVSGSVTPQERVSRMAGIRQTLQQTRQQVLSDLGPEVDSATYNSIVAMFDHYDETVEWAVTSDNAEQIFNTVESLYGVQMMEAIQGLGLIRSVMGPQGVEALFGDAMMREYLQSGEASAAFERLMRNEAEPEDIATVTAVRDQMDRVRNGEGTPEDVQAAGPVLLASARRATESFNADPENEHRGNAFVRAYLPVLNMTGMAVFQSGMTNPTEAANAAQELFGMNKARAVAAVGDPQLVNHTTVMAERALNVLRQGIESGVGMGMGMGPTSYRDRIVFDASTGYYVHNSENIGLEEGLQRMEAAGSDFQSQYSAMRQVSRSNVEDYEAQQVVQAMNTLIDFLAVSRGEEGNPRDLRARWAGVITEEGIGAGLPFQPEAPAEAPAEAPEVAEEASGPFNYTRMLVEQEGGSHSQGYIPTGGSGVTIGAGLDLGQWTEAELRDDLGISAETVEKLSPFVGLSTRRAVEAAGLNPQDLNLTPEETAEVDQALFRRAEERASSVNAWDNLGQSAREALVSIRHWAGQLGAESSKLAPGGTNYLWEVLQRSDATDADVVDALRRTLADMPDPREARYNRLERIINDLT